MKLLRIAKEVWCLSCGKSFWVWTPPRKGQYVVALNNHQCYHLTMDNIYIEHTLITNNTYVTNAAFVWSQQELILQKLGSF